MKTKQSSFFWPSYTDLMTSLFFIMLVLYVLTFVRLRLQQEALKKQKKATEEQLRTIKEIQQAVKELPEKYFRYDDRNRRFELKEQISFGKGLSAIPDQYYTYLFEVGIELERLINNLKDRKDGQSIRYLVVIEGMASNDQYGRNYELSYQRALSLFEYWQRKAITFDPGICEIQIAGSGTGGVGRDNVNEANNQRFLIQIIPKIGELK